MNEAKAKILELLKRASQVEMTYKDYQNFKILMAKGFDSQIYVSLESSIARKELMQQFRPPLPFVTPPKMRGDIILGEGINGLNRYDSKYAPLHSLSIGMTGAGKTVFLTFLLLQYLAIASGVWSFDYINRELRGIRRLAEREGFEVIVCRHENLRINLLDPQGTDPASYINICSEFITLCLNLPPVAKHILKICINRLYQKSGLLSDPHATPPTLPELIEEVLRFEGNKAAKDAILIRLQALLANKKQVLNVRRGMPVSVLSRKNIVWEFDGLESQYQNLFTSYLLAVLFTQRVENRCNDLVCLFLDEASRLYSKEAETANEGPSYLSLMTTVIRKMKIALFVWSQSCKNLSHTLIANSGMKILCQVGSADDYSLFGKSMGLDAKTVQWAKPNLEIGDQIIKTNFGWRYPFLNKTPLIELPKDVTNAEVQHSCQSLLDLVPKERPQVLMLPAPTVATETTETTVVSPATKLSADENNLLNQIKANPFVMSATRHYKMAGLSTKKAAKAKQGLLDKHLIKETPLESGKRGAAQAFLEVIPEKSAGKNGGTLHNLLRDKARNWFIAQNCDTQIEAAINFDTERRYIDLSVIWPDGRTEAVEIETEDSARAVENIRKSIAAGMDIISVLTPNSKVRYAIETRVVAEISGQHNHTIKFPTVSDYDSK